ncbi:hypothetical protein GA0116948_1336 [Chitinophaga costaii]|uniref:Uncharacterized protein n=1 Tax=Chitinophaga costaii TaxID=1335309 RepID=A0A1C4G8Q1_9BACT|nr:hypothetical protein GA0116948_1336 [Chitinophaga costaii]
MKRDSFLHNIFTPVCIHGIANTPIYYIASMQIDYSAQIHETFVALSSYLI